MAVSTKTPRVVIIGGGMSGLSAAEHLHKHGCQVVVLEASKRLGGRMNTVQFGYSAGDIVELGANWIHGAALTNPVISLAAQHRLLKDSVLLDRMEGFSYRSDGHAIPKQCVDHLWCIFQEIEQETETVTVVPGDDTNLEQCMKKRFTEEVVKRQLKYDPEDVNGLFNCFMNYFRFHVGGFPECMPVLDTYVVIPGGNVKVPSGMSAIIQALACQLPKDSILYDHKVTGIHWSCPDIMSVHCDNDRSFEADHVIVTISLGYLKKHYATLFLPELPTDKIDALQKIGFGKVNKIFLLYDKPFWRKGEGGIKLAWTDADAKLNSESEWYKKIFAFDEVLNNDHVLVAWISGNEAEYMEKLDDIEIIKTCTKVIRKFLGDESLPKPSAVLRSNWCTQELFMGSYSYPTFSSGCGAFEKLSHPLTDGRRVPRVLFAGEATSSAMSSTMHGARSSGIREAERLLHLHRIKSPSKL